MPLFPRLDVKALWRPQTMKELDAEMLGAGMQTLAGVNVSEQTALNYAAVFSCLRVRAETLSQISLHLYRPTAGGVEKAKGDPRYALVHDRPNGEMTSVQWRMASSLHHDAWGNAYCAVDIPERGRNAGWAQSIYPLKPERMEVFRDDNGSLQYRYTRRRSDGSNETIIYPAWRILHVRSMSLDGIMGLSPVAMMRLAVGLGMATEEFGARFFGQGAHVGAVMSFEPEYKPDQVDKIKDGLRKDYAGLAQSHGLLVVGGGAKFTPISMPLDDAQFLATRKFQLEEIARIYRVPPHLIADLDKATFSNIEQQALEFATYTMTPYCKAWEQELDMKLLTEREQAEGWHFEFDLNTLKRGDIKSRFEAYKIGREIGIYSPNDIRVKENENPREGGDEYWDEGPSGQGSAQARLEPVRRDAYARIAKREEQDIVREAEKRAKKADAEGFSQWLGSFLVGHEVFCARVLAPYFDALGDRNGAESAAKAHVSTLRTVLSGAEITDSDSIRARLEGLSA